MWLRASHRHSAAPVGSAITDIRPASMTSNGSACTVAPSSSARAVTSSTDDTVT
jgi:hypothetical protein